MVLLMTDGFIGDDESVLGTLQSHLREETRVFGVGVGNDVNRYLVAKMGEVGRGASTFVNLRRSEEEVAREFESRIRGPVLTSVKVDTDGLPVSDVYPRVMPDLFSGQPLFLVGKFHGTGQGVLRITGRVRGRSATSTCPSPSPSPRRRTAPCEPVGPPADRRAVGGELTAARSPRWCRPSPPRRSSTG